MLAGTDEAALSVFGLLKLLRIFRLSKIIMYMRQREEIKGTMKLLQLLLFLYIYVHLGGCIFFMIVSYHEQWIPPTDSILGGTELYDANFQQQYWYSFYHSVFLLVGVETNPLTNKDFQTFFSSALIICGALF